MVLFHPQVINALPVPVGVASEERLEAQHKTIRRVRETHTRKSSRVNSNTDLVHWLLQSSSPLVAQFRKRRVKQKRRELLPEAQRLLYDAGDYVLSSDSSDSSREDSSSESDQDMSENGED